MNGQFPNMTIYCPQQHHSESCNEINTVYTDIYTMYINELMHIMLSQEHHSESCNEINTVFVDMCIMYINELMYIKRGPC